MRNVNLYRGGSRGRIGQQNLDQIGLNPTIPFALQTPRSALASFGADMVRALTAKSQENREKEDMAAYMAARSTKFDPSAITPLAEDSPYLSVQREDMAQALAGTPQSPLGGSVGDVFSPQTMPVDGTQPSSLGISVDDVFSPDAPTARPREEGYVEPAFVEGLIEQGKQERQQQEDAALDAGQRALFGADPASNPAMQAALIGDVGTRAEDEAAYMAEQYRNRITPRQAVRDLTPQTKAGRDAQYAYELSQIERDEALTDEQREQKFQKELKAIGPPHAPVAPKVSIKPVADPDSDTGWSFKDVLDPTSGFLGEAQSQAARFDPLSASKAKFANLVNERYQEATAGRQEIEGMLGKIEQMRGLAQRVDSGPLTNFKTDFMSLGNSLGMGFDVENIANVEAMRAKGMEFILDIIAGTKGAISEREMAAFEKASPGVGNSKLGNKQILDLAEATAQRLKVAHEAARTAYRADGASVVDLDDAFFKAQEEWGGFGFIFAPKDLPPELQDGWSGLTWEKKKRHYKLHGIEY